MSRPPRPDDLYRLRIPTDTRLSPDGRSVAMTVETVAPDFAGYRSAIWLVPTDPADGAARQFTVGARHDHHPRFSPDGRTLAFLSDRRLYVEEEPDRPPEPRDREDGMQVHLLSLDGGEARRLTDLPRGVGGFAWSPDGTRLVVETSSIEATRDADLRRRGIRAPEPGTPPPSDYRFIDRLEYQANGAGFVFHRVPHLWLVDATDGTATRLTTGRAGDHEPAWSPDGTRVAFSSNRGRDPDLRYRPGIHVVDVATRAVRRVTRDPGAIFWLPTWLDDETLLALGNPVRGGGTRADIWRFAADGSDARPGGGTNLSARHDLMPGSTMNSDVTPGEDARLRPTADGRAVLFSAPIHGSYELWRLDLRTGGVTRLTEGRQYISGWDAVRGPRGRMQVAFLRSSPTETPDLHLLDGAGAVTRRTALNAEALDDLALATPIERRVTVEGREIQGWYLPPAGGAPGEARPSARAPGAGAPPLVVEIHGGPHTLYGWSPFWEFQVLAANGIGVFYCNPRGSEGYGDAFNEANHRDWGPGPMRDVLAGVDALVADGLADPERLGVTGGSYGGYLTNWIVAHDHRFRAALAARSVSDMSMLFTTGDISGADWARLEFDTAPWEEPDFYREMSPITHAARIRTPLLIQHSERDLRTTISQAEAMFTVMRSHRLPVRLLRVPDDDHELTRSGTPFRRVENLEVVLGWFRHFLVDGKRGMPPLPKVHGGR